MKKIRLHAVREDDACNFKSRWRYRTQMLGSILVWAYRANATQVDYDAQREIPFGYYASDGSPVSSEFPQPPTHLNPGIRKHLFLDTIDGHPIMRPLRRLLRYLTRRTPSAIFLVPDFQAEIESEWRMAVHDDHTSFELIGTSPYVRRQRNG